MPACHKKLPAPTTGIEPELIGIADLCVIFGRARPWIYDQLRSDPSFPKPVTLGPRYNAWRLREVRAYIDALPRHELSGLSGVERQVMKAATRRAARSGGDEEHAHAP